METAKGYGNNGEDQCQRRGFQSVKRISNGEDDDEQGGDLSK
jgi:hypothetical protein